MGLWDRVTRMETRLPYELRLRDQKSELEGKQVLRRLEACESALLNRAKAEAAIDWAGWFKVAAAVFLLASALVAIATGNTELVVKAAKGVQSLK